MKRFRVKVIRASSSSARLEITAEDEDAARIAAQEILDDEVNHEDLIDWREDEWLDDASILDIVEWRQS